MGHMGNGEDVMGNGEDVIMGDESVTPIFKEQMECIILCAPRDQSHIR
jgi:hypothetical protein